MDRRLADLDASVWYAVGRRGGDDCVGREFGPANFARCVRATIPAEWGIVVTDRGDFWRRFKVYYKLSS
ncbi:hypothetical protein D3C81_2053100 [compost metagenome]